MVSEVVQLGPRDPMKEVFPNKTLFWTVKLWAEVMAMAYPNAPERWLLRTVPELLVFWRYSLPNQVRGPIATPIL